MPDDLETNLHRRNSRFAQIGVIAGVIMGVAGTGAGFYFGVVAPAIKSGSWQGLSTHVLWAGGGLLFALVLGASIISWRLVRRKSRMHDGDADDW